MDFESQDYRIEWSKPRTRKVWKFMYSYLDSYLEVCLLGMHISDYPNICNGKTRIPGVNDGEEFELVHVSDPVARRWQKYANRFNPSVNISKNLSHPVRSEHPE